LLIGANPLEELQRGRLKEAVAAGHSRIGTEISRSLCLRDVEEMSIVETAKALGITEASVRRDLLRARLQMRDALAPGYDGGWSSEEGSWKK